MLSFIALGQPAPIRPAAVTRSTGIPTLRS